MAEVTPDTLADLLLVDTDAHFAAVVAYARYLTTSPKPDCRSTEYAQVVGRMDRFAEIWQPFYYDFRGDQTHQATVMATLHARHLPRIVEAFSLFPVWIRVMLPWASVIAALQRWENHFLGRYLRTDEERGRSFLIAVLEAVDGLMLSEDDAAHAAVGFGRQWADLVGVAFVGLLSSCGDSPPDPLFPWIKRSQYFSGRYEAYSDWLGRRLQETRDFAYTIGMLNLGPLAKLLSTEPGVSLKNLEAYDRYQEVYPGLRCELLRLGLGGSPTDKSHEAIRSTCVEIGEVSLLCSKCKSVRYCSKEHQRADWKAHKPTCIKPSW